MAGIRQHDPCVILKHPITGCFSFMIGTETIKNHPIILFDGVCNFCNSSINFIISQDKKKIFLFAALQSEAGQKILGKYNLPKEGFDSFILIEEGKVYKKSSAAIRVYGKLPWYWKWAQTFWIVPPPIRNAVYDFIAKNRYKWFGKKDSCMIPTLEVKERFVA